jgi:hypothetical protein
MKKLKKLLESLNEDNKLSAVVKTMYQKKIINDSLLFAVVVEFYFEDRSSIMETYLIDYFEDFDDAKHKFDETIKDFLRGKIKKFGDYGMVKVYGIYDDTVFLENIKKGYDEGDDLIYTLEEAGADAIIEKRI